MINTDSNLYIFATVEADVVEKVKDSIIGFAKKNCSNNYRYHNQLIFVKSAKTSLWDYESSLKVIRIF